MPPNCVAGISQSLNCARSSASRKLRTMSLWLSCSCRESGDIDGLKARHRLPSVFEIVGNRPIGKIAEPIVVAIVPNLGGEFRLGAQRVLPLIGEQTIEFGAASLQGFPRSRGGPGDRGRRCPPALLSHRVRPARPAPGDDRPGVRTGAGRRGGASGGRAPAGHHGDLLRRGARGHADQRPRGRDGARGGRAAGHRLPGTAAGGPAGPRRPPRRGDDHR